MKEEFLHYIWKYGLYRANSLKTDDGIPVQVINPGWYNLDAGPDFRQARIKIGDAVWIGHIEVHMKASDWYHHGHQKDPAYNPVILHIVLQNDRAAYNEAGIRIPSIQLCFNESVFEHYQSLIGTLTPIPCSVSWKRLPVIQVEQAVSAMAVERLESRMNGLKTRLEQEKGGWKDVFMQVFFRAFGFGKNQDNFDFLAQSLPSWIIEKHKSNLFQLESLLFGQAGLLPERCADPYPAALRSEFNYLRKKYLLEPDERMIWRNMRTRPSNHPVLRLAQLAAWFHQQPDYFASLMANGSKGSWMIPELFVSSYWKTHYSFDQIANPASTALGASACHLILLNAILPLHAFYQSEHGHSRAKWEWLERLEALPAEQNYVTRLWRDAGFRIPNAFYSQGFLHIYKNYCVDRRCLACRLGQLILQF